MQVRFLISRLFRPGLEHFRDLFERLDHSDLVVDGHDGDEGGVGSECGPELVQIDETISLDG